LINKERCIDALGNNSHLAEKIDGYEERDGQLEMAEIICDAFNDGKIAVIEAGTGIGKSFAYLVPAVLWAQLYPDEHIVISTATINLQQQLYEKDIPIIADAAAPSLRYSLLMGRSNYLCLRRLQQQMRDAPLLAGGGSSELGAVYEWSQHTETGIRTELTPAPSQQIWSLVCSETDNCLGAKCGSFRDCFVYRARRKAAKSQIIVVNHHVLFADISMKYEADAYDEPALLPPFAHVICDEAHHLEQNAAQYYSDQYTILSLFKVFSQLKDAGSRSKNAESLLSRLQRRSPDTDSFKEIDACIASCRKQAETVDAYFLKLAGQNRSVWLQPETESGSAVQGAGRVHPSTAEIAGSLGPLTSDIGRLGKLLSSVDESIEETEENLNLLYQLRAQINRIQQYSLILNSFMEYRKYGEIIHWVEQIHLRGRGRQYTAAVCRRTPRSIAETLYKSFFSKMRTVINTSATLAVNRHFSYWKEPLGLEHISQDRILEKQVSSPFDYKKRVMLAVPHDTPSVQDEKNYQAFLEQALLELTMTAEGKTLILFTSFKLLEALYNSLSVSLPEDYTVLHQERGMNRQLLLDAFRKTEKQVLLATESFWEGIDVPGDALKQVIITRLPFQVPTDPIFLAKEDDLIRSGRSPFMELSLPRASIKLKQGFGRLMRKTNDHGIVCILDNRIVKKTYGAVLLHSLPESLRSIKEYRKMTEDIENFFYR